MMFVCTEENAIFLYLKLILDSNNYQFVIEQEIVDLELISD